MIPIFYHVPKCAGTYIKILMRRLILALYGVDNLLIYQLFDNDGYIKCLVYCDSTSLGIPILNSFGFSRDVNYNDFIKNKHKLKKIYLISIVARGFKHHHEIRSHFPKGLPFMLLRNPFDRQQSMYNYISSAQSGHEKTHGSYQSKTLEEFLGSYEVEDSWLIRQFLDLPDNHIITQEDFEVTCDIMAEITIGDISQALAILDSIFKQCYNITTDSINLQFNNNLQNINPIPKIDIDKIDSQILERFNQRTIWDQKLYAHFT